MLSLLININEATERSRKMIIMNDLQYNEILITFHYESRYSVM